MTPEDLKDIKRKIRKGLMPRYLFARAPHRTNGLTLERGPDTRAFNLSTKQQVGRKGKLTWRIIDTLAFIRGAK